MNTELVTEALQGRFVQPKPRTAEEEIADEFSSPSSSLPTKWNDVLQPVMTLNVEESASKIASPPVYDPRVRIHFNRTGLSGNISALKLKASLPTQEGAMAMTRKMTKTKDIRGTSGQMPFTPGGIDVSEQSSVADLHRNDLGLLDIAPGSSRTSRFGGKTDANSGDIIHEQGEDEDLPEQDNEDSADETSVISENNTTLSESKFDTIDDLLPPTSNFMRHVVKSAQQAEPVSKTWAHMVDINQKMENFHELVPHPARTWPFELDNFQKEAVYHLEQGDSVFIAAHTSAGKTVVAEYAMSMAAQHMTKCIYTSPIKALSNQKYRDFKEEYDDVGILTGDVQLNPDASTLIMTTEILRSMSYRGADIIRDVEFIIFDEVHYVNDSDRGVVWEEVIIMLPDHVKLVMLSATVPNTFEFANWIGRTKQKDVYVISTPKRPVPLKHHLWANRHSIEVVDEHRKFNEKSYREAQSLVNPPKSGPGSSQSGQSSSGGRGGTAHRYSRPPVNTAQKASQKQMGPSASRFNQSSSKKNELLTLIELMRSQQLLPGVFFVFSRKLCEQYAIQVQSMQLNNAREKSQVYMFVDKAVSRLRKEDRNLPQIEMLRSSLQQGIGLHHSGLSPIMKEVVEILFAKGLVKLLFATETFAMGLNLPTRTVVFTEIKKFDSKVRRFLTPGEYTQMAGRAGRRGLDTVGTVIIMNENKDSVIPRAPLEQMISGTPLKLSSQFRLTYNMILSLLRIEAVKVEDVIQQSFSENAQFTLRPELEKKIVLLDGSNSRQRQQIESLARSLSVDSSTLALLQQFTSQVLESNDAFSSVNQEIVRLKWFKLKKTICICRNPDSNDLEIHVIQSTDTEAHPPRIMTSKLARITGGLSHIPYIAMLFPEATATFNVEFERRTSCSIDASRVEFFSGFVPSQKKLSNLSNEAYDQYKELIASNSPALFNEQKHFTITSISFKQALLERDQLLDAYKSSVAETLKLTDSLGDMKVIKLFEELKKLVEGEKEAQSIKESATLSNTALLPEYGQRINVLRTANYLDDSLNVALKGRVACEISTGYESYLTELIMDNFSGSYEPEEIVALLSAFVFDGARGVEEPNTVTPRLDEGKERLLELVDYVQKLAIKNQVTLTQDEADFGENNRFALMQVVYEWARGMTFSEITQLTTVQEGSIVRVINRLDEICRSVMNAARIIGEVDLYDKLAIAQERIRRDIVFCSSLYL